MKKEYMYLLVGVGLGLVFSPQLRKLPLIGKVPTV